MEGDHDPPIFDALSLNYASFDLVHSSLDVDDSTMKLKLVEDFEKVIAKITNEFQKKSMNLLWTELDLESRVCSVTDGEFLKKLKEFAPKLVTVEHDMDSNLLDDTPEMVLKLWKAMEPKNKFKLLRILRTSKCAKEQSNGHNKVDSKKQNQGFHWSKGAKDRNVDYMNSVANLQLNVKLYSFVNLSSSVFKCDLIIHKDSDLCHPEVSTKTVADMAQ